LIKGKILTAKDIEEIVFGLSDDLIIRIVGFLPAREQITSLNFSVLTQVVWYIMKLPFNPISGQIKFPDWDEKLSLLILLVPILRDPSSKKLFSTHSSTISSIS